MRILIVEDDHKIANSLKQDLGYECFAVDVTYSGVDVCDPVSTETYDLIVLGSMLLGMDRVEICNKPRNKNMHLPILMFATKSELEDRVSGLNSDPMTVAIRLY